MGRSELILLDTHIWVRWLVGNEPLPEGIIEMIETSDAITVSAISIWEVVLLQKRQRIELPVPIDQWLDAALLGSDVQVLPITGKIAHLAGILPEHHKDPADRLIIATSLVNQSKLISFDSVFPSYTELNNLLITAEY
ncbi:type II toxin-antitoxin system VapC family toxin [Methylomonas methanica]|uniref:type II toxin-antitoxin system VapC family toxin n=1 Tax=Methylomonas methanica TaxID=421 RepID=UPI0007C8B5D4|nr:type II toxin-antitoxin system VapC family toxin [Methylomonas methanica]